MKKTTLFFVLAASATLLLSSCASVSTDTKDIKYMPIRFKPLTRNDVSLIGNLQVESTITGKGGAKGKVLDKTYTANYKKGLISKSEATEILYFAPGNGEAITGSLYENEIFNAVYGPGAVSLGKGGFFAAFFAKYKKRVQAADPAMDFAYYALVEKYPDVDYFINVRFDRKTVLKGKTFSETIIVKADGLKLKTD